MKIKEIIWQHRRDFKAVYKCENCGTEITGTGYDDDNFHQNVVPKFKCESCGKSTNSLGLKVEKIKTKYAEGEQI